MPVTIEKEIKKTGQIIRKIYETVAERVQKFREVCPVSEGWALKTEIRFPNDSSVLAVTQMIDPNASIVATGTAEEMRNSSYINKTSAVENAETSAIGRCLFAAGFGGGEFCSADELLTALKRQEKIKEQELKIIKPNASGTSTKSNPARRKASSAESSPSEILGPRLKGITYRREGNLIIAAGNTFPVRGVLDTAGFKWTPGIKAMAKEVTT